MLHVFSETLQKTRATLQETPATLQKIRATLNETRATSHGSVISVVSATRQVNGRCLVMSSFQPERSLPKRQSNVVC